MKHLRHVALLLQNFKSVFVSFFFKLNTVNSAILRPVSISKFGNCFAYLYYYFTRENKFTPLIFVLLM